MSTFFGFFNYSKKNKNGEKIGNDFLNETDEFILQHKRFLEDSEEAGRQFDIEGLSHDKKLREAHQTLHTLQQKASLYDQQNSPHRFAVVNSDKNNVPQVFPGRAHTIVDNKDLSDKPEGNFHARQGKK